MLVAPRPNVCLIHKLIDVGTRKRLFSAPLPIPSSSFCLSFLHSRLSIASAHAFLLVYSVTDPTSFASVKSRLEEIKEQRTDFEVGLTVSSQTLTMPMLKSSSVNRNRVSHPPIRRMCPLSSPGIRRIWFARWITTRPSRGSILPSPSRGNSSQLS